MNSLREEMRKNAGVIEENATAPQIGELICKLRDKNFNNEEILNRINTVISKDWVNIILHNNSKTIHINIIPMNWDGTKIDDAAAEEAKNIEDKIFIKKIINLWAKKLLEKIKADYKNYKIDIANKEENIINN